MKLPTILITVLGMAVSAVYANADAEAQLVAEAEAKAMTPKTYPLGLRSGRNIFGKRRCNCKLIYLIH
jgi:hypothetical protein